MLTFDWQPLQPFDLRCKVKIFRLIVWPVWLSLFSLSLSHLSSTPPPPPTTFLSVTHCLSLSVSFTVLVGFAIAYLLLLFAITGDRSTSRFHDRITVFQHGFGTFCDFNYTHLIFRLWGYWHNKYNQVWPCFFWLGSGWVWVTVVKFTIQIRLESDDFHVMAPNASHFCHTSRQWSAVKCELCSSSHPFCEQSWASQDVLV